MAEHEFNARERAYFRRICQADARERANRNFPSGDKEKERWYDETWRKNYAAYVGEDIPKRCPCCCR